MIAEHDRIPEIALEWHRQGKGAVLATVVETWGSAPRPVGSQLAVSGEAEIMGSVSGGCVEGAVVAEALEALDDGRCRILEFGVSDDDAFAVGLACGGRIRVMVEPVGQRAGARRRAARAGWSRRAPRARRWRSRPTRRDWSRAGARLRRPAAGASTPTAPASREDGDGAVPLASTTRRCGWPSSARCTSPSRWPRWRG